MKRTFSLFLSLIMLLTLLPACASQTDAGQEPEPKPEQTSDNTIAFPAPPPALDVAKAISAAAPDEPEGGPEVLTDQLADYAEAAYGLDAGMWDDCAVLRAAGVRAYEIAVIYLATQDDAERVEKVMEDYLSARGAAFGGYAPEQANLVRNGKVSLEGGRFVGLFICEEPQAAAELFASIIASGALPEGEEVPVQEPEQQLTDMERLQSVLQDACSDEIDALNKDALRVSLASPRFLDNFAEMVEETYGLTADQWEDGFILMSIYPEDFFELAVFRMKDQDAVQAGMENLSAYRDGLKDRCSEWEDGVRVVSEENSDAYLRVTGAHICAGGQYLAFFLCENAEEVSEVFRQTVPGLSPGEPYQSITPVEQPDPVKITDGVYFVEVPWPDAEGTPDPDHPGRILFEMPENPFMTLYDTTAIVDAWRNGDLSKLSSYDKDIYVEAKKVLDEIIRDGMSDFEKEVEIYDWVLQNIEYDYSRMDVLEETARDAYTPYGGLVYNEGVCLGYASTFQLLMDLAGVECMTVIGAGQNSREEHAWNLVKLNGEWYGADTTWDYSFYSAGMMDGRQWRFFNVTSDYLARTGHQWDYDSVPEAVKEDHGFPG